MLRRISSRIFCVQHFENFLQRLPRHFDLKNELRTLRSVRRRQRIESQAFGSTLKTFSLRLCVRDRSWWLLHDLCGLLGKWLRWMRPRGMLVDFCKGVCDRTPDRFQPTSSLYGRTVLGNSRRAVAAFDSCFRFQFILPFQVFQLVASKLFRLHS